MSHDPLLDKMDALLKKHRGGNASQPVRETGSNEPIPVEAAAPPPDAWLPVLTDVVVMGSVSVSQTIEASGAPDEAIAEPVSTPAAESHPPEEVPVPDAAPSPAISDTLAEQLMVELEPRLTALLQDKLATQIRNSLDNTVSALLAQLDVNIREIVREAIDGKLGKR